MHSCTQTNTQPSRQHKATIWRPKKTSCPLEPDRQMVPLITFFRLFSPAQTLFNRWMCGKKKTFHLVFFWSRQNDAAAAATLKQRHTFHCSSPRTNTINVIYVPKRFSFFSFIRGARLLSDKLSSHLHCLLSAYNLSPAPSLHMSSSSCRTAVTYRCSQSQKIAL